MSNRYTKNKKQKIREKLILVEEARMEKKIKKELAEEEKARRRKSLVDRNFKKHIGS